MSEQEMQMKLSSQQGKVEALRQEVASMNKEREFWQQVRIQASIAAMQAQLSSYETMHSIMQRLKERGITDNGVFDTVANISLLYADALIEELKKGGGHE